MSLLDPRVRTFIRSAWTGATAPNWGSLIPGGSAVCDYIVIGGGASGAAAAKRLARVTNQHVILLEAGDSIRKPSIVHTLPVALPWILQKNPLPIVESTPQPALNGRRVPIPIPTAVGGSAAFADTAFLPGTMDDWLDATTWPWATSIGPALHNGFPELPTVKPPRVCPSTAEWIKTFAPSFDPDQPDAAAVAPPNSGVDAAAAAAAAAAPSDPLLPHRLHNRSGSRLHYPLLHTQRGASRPLATLRNGQRGVLGAIIATDALRPQTLWVCPQQPVVRLVWNHDLLPAHERGNIPLAANYDNADPNVYAAARAAVDAQNAARKARAGAALDAALARVVRGGGGATAGAIESGAAAPALPAGVDDALVPIPVVSDAKRARQLARAEKAYLRITERSRALGANREGPEAIRVRTIAAAVGAVVAAAKAKAVAEVGGAVAASSPVASPVPPHKLRAALGVLVGDGSIWEYSPAAPATAGAGVAGGHSSAAGDAVVPSTSEAPLPRGQRHVDDHVRAVAIHNDREPFPRTYAQRALAARRGRLTSEDLATLTSRNMGDFVVSAKELAAVRSLAGEFVDDIVSGRWSATALRLCGGATDGGPLVGPNGTHVATFATAEAIWEDHDADVFAEGETAGPSAWSRPGADGTPRVVGVQTADGSTVMASKGVILAAGAVGSAWLLMCSGVGPAEMLRQGGVRRIVADVPGVGHNLTYQPTVAVRARRPGYCSGHVPESVRKLTYAYAVATAKGYLARRRAGGWGEGELEVDELAAAGAAAGAKVEGGTTAEDAKGKTAPATAATLTTSRNYFEGAAYIHTSGLGPQPPYAPLAAANGATNRVLLRYAPDARVCGGAHNDVMVAATLVKPQSTGRVLMTPLRRIQHEMAVAAAAAAAASAAVTPAADGAAATDSASTTSPVSTPAAPVTAAAATPVPATSTAVTHAISRGNPALEYELAADGPRGIYGDPMIDLRLLDEPADVRALCEGVAAAAASLRAVGCDNVSVGGGIGVPVASSTPLLEATAGTPASGDGAPAAEPADTEAEVASADALYAAVRDTVVPWMGSGVGTCRAGNVTRDPLAVVDATSFAVRGVTGLYVTGSAVLPSPASGAAHLASAAVGHLTARALGGVAVDQVASSAHERLVYRSQLAQEMGLDVAASDAEFEENVRSTSAERAAERAQYMAGAGGFQGSGMAHLYAKAATAFREERLQSRDFRERIHV